MEWNLFTYEEVLNKPKDTTIYYTDADYRNYIKEHFKPVYYNEVFYNIVMNQYFCYEGFKSKVEPKEELEYFKTLYNNFTYHFQNEELTIFSLKRVYSNHPEEYSLFINVHGDFIVELPPVKDLFNERQCAPACAIWWFNPDGTAADMNKYLTLTPEEKEIWVDFVKNKNEIINPKDTKAFSYSEWWQDRREYYFFCKLKLHRFGKFGRVDDKHNADWFSDYEFTLKELIYYLTDKQEVANA